MFTEDRFDDFVETTFIFQFVSNVTVENMHFFSNLQIGSPQQHALCTFEIVAPKIRLCKKILDKNSRSCEKFGGGCILPLWDLAVAFVEMQANSKIKTRGPDAAFRGGSGTFSPVQRSIFIR